MNTISVHFISEDEITFDNDVLEKNFLVATNYSNMLIAPLPMIEDTYRSTTKMRKIESNPEKLYNIHIGQKVTILSKYGSFRSHILSFGEIPFGQCGHQFSITLDNTIHRSCDPCIIDLRQARKESSSIKWKNDYDISEEKIRNGIKDIVNTQIGNWMRKQKHPKYKIRISRPVRLTKDLYLVGFNALYYLKPYTTSMGGECGGWWETARQGCWLLNDLEGTLRVVDEVPWAPESLEADEGTTKELEPPTIIDFDGNGKPEILLYQERGVGQGALFEINNSRFEIKLPAWKYISPCSRCD